VSEPVNQFHKTLRALSAEDPTLQRAIAWVHQIIAMRGYDAVHDDPGMRAWVEENYAMCRRIADQRRAAYAQAEAG